MICVRFAPSPTGLLHFGNARAALWNKLFALKHGGKFLLRIDDTDIERSREEYVEAIFRDMAWLGLHHDLTFRQSERMDAYAAATQKLKDKGLLYPCYETPEELAFKRKQQLARRQPPQYDRAALKLTDAQKTAFEKEGRRPHWRLQLTDTCVQWNDLIRGSVSIEGSNLSDPVLVKADDGPVYTLASVVDDIDSNITHIIRGEDHVSNTAVQLQLVAALGEDMGRFNFAHFPLLVDAEGGGLSKRLGSLSLESLRDEGIEPETITSMLAFLGTSETIEPTLDLEGLVGRFDLGKVSKSPPHFDMRELETLNHKVLAITPYAKIQAQVDKDVTVPLWDLFRANLTKQKDLGAWMQAWRGAFEVPAHEPQDLVKAAMESLPPSPWDATAWDAWTQGIKAKVAYKGPELFKPLRRMLMGMDHGPELKALFLLMGHDEVKPRIMRCLKRE